MSEEQSEKKQEITKKCADENCAQEIELEEQKVFKKVVAEVIQSEFSGPIPPPAIIEG